MHVTDLYFSAARNYPDRLALTGAGGDFTYAQVFAHSNRIARRLQSLGLGPGARFAVMSPNTGPALIAVLGSMRAGLAWCNLNMRAELPDILHILTVGRCEVVFFHSAAAGMVPEILARVPSLKHVVCLDRTEATAPSLEAWLDGVGGGPLDFRVPEDALGIQGATGGTTGRSKLTQTTNRCFVGSLQGLSLSMEFSLPPVNLAVAPITHAAGVIALAMGQFGGTTIMMANPDLDAIIEAIERHRVSLLFLPPTLVYMLLAHPAAQTADFSSLRYLLVGGAPMAPDKIVEAVKRFGPVLAQGFGQSEAGMPLTFMAPHEVLEAIADPSKRHRLASCGRPTLIVEAMEAMGEQGHILPPGETGELVLRGPTVMQGYLDDPAATAEIQAHGWHHTGDIGRRDADGYVYITDRKRDMIISGGFNIFPFEIESALLQHAAVQDCAVIGVPDEKWGEVVKACVQLKPGAQAAAEELIAHARERVGSMKAPKSVDFIASLPRSPAGKLLKRDLRAPYWEGQTRQVG